MFTGIIATTGTIQALQPHGQDLTLSIQAPHWNWDSVQLGDSIAVNGVCLTVTALINQGFSADVSVETLNLTSLGSLKVGSTVNLESALTLSTPLGGHLVSGHVDGLGELISRTNDARSERLVFRLPKNLSRYVAVKGSITIDGISLTVNAVTDDTFSVNIIPHTNERTTLKDLKIGQKVNLEVDLIARYLERLMMGTSEPHTISLSALKEAGF